MIPEFMVRAFLAAASVGLVGAVLGCFVLWRRMAYFGDSLSHTALLGVALGLVLGVSPSLMMVFICLVFALALVVLTRVLHLTQDSSLGLIAHSALALGLVLISVFDAGQVDLHSLLMGDILTVRWRDVGVITGVSALVLSCVWVFWSRFLLITVNRDLALSQGLRVFGLDLLFVLMLGLIVAVAVQIVGVLMVSALLILPSAIARPLSRSPEMMACLAALTALVSIVTGLIGSYQFDTPSGPTIVISALGLFIVSALGRFLVKRFLV